MIDILTGIAIALAVLGAVCFACAAVLQHHAVSTESGPPGESDAGTGALSLRGLLAVTRRPGWLLGLGVAAAGSALHAGALVLAPLSVVQPIGVLAVPIAVLLTAVQRGRVPAGGVFVGVLLSVGGVGVFVATAASTAVSSPPPDQSTLIASLVVALIVLVLAGVGLARSGWVRCVACAMAGAVAFGLVSALVRAVSQSVASGHVGVLDPPVVAAVAGVGASVLVGGWLVQQAFASGPPEVVIACLTVVDPIVAVLLGAVLLGEGSATPAETWLLLVTAAVIATAGVVALARHHPDAVAARAARAGSVPAAPPSPERSQTPAAYARSAQSPHGR